MLFENQGFCLSQAPYVALNIKKWQLPPSSLRLVAVIIIQIIALPK